MGEEIGKFTREQVTKALDSTDIDEKLKAKLESATPQSVKDAIANAKLFMADALIRKIVIERTKKAVEEMVAKIKSGEVAQSVLASVKDLKIRVKELGDRAQAAGKLIQDMLKKQDALKQQVDAPASKDNEATV